MLTRKVIGSAILVLLVGLPLRAQDSVLHRVPGDASVVVHIRGFENTKNRLLALTRNALGDLAVNVVPAIEQGIEQALDGRKLDGLEPAGSCLIAMKSFSSNPLPAVIIAKARDADQFAKSFFRPGELAPGKGPIREAQIAGMSLYYTARQGYVYLATSRQWLEECLKGPADGGLAKSISQPAAERLLKSDLAVYCNLEHLKKEFAEQLKELKKLMEGIPVSAPDEATRKVLQGVLDTVVRAVDDSQAALLSVDFEPDGLAVHAGVRFKADSLTSGFLKRQKQSSIKSVAQLPRGMLFYASYLLSDDLYEFVQAFTAGAPGGKDLTQATRKMLKAGPGEAMSAFTFAGGLAGIQIEEFADPEQGLQASLEMLRSTAGKVEQTGIKSVQVRERARRVGAITFHEVAMELDIAGMLSQEQVGGVPGLDKAVENFVRGLLGGDRITAWMGIHEKRVMTVYAPRWAEAEKLVQDYLDGKTPLRTAAGYKLLSKHLPEQGTVYVVIDSPRLAGWLAGIMGEFMKAFGAPGQVKPVKLRDDGDFIGLVLGLKPEVFTFDLWIPATTVRDFRDAFGPLIPVFQQGGAGIGAGR
ncbi:MAG: hypothetical protein C4297_09950 [Gemmataceae bacterium]